MVFTLARQHRQLVAAIAAGYAPGGEPSSDVIAEGQVGLMWAICRFDPNGELRLRGLRSPARTWRHLR